MSQYTKEQLQEIKSKIDYFEFYKQYLPELQVRGVRAWSTCIWHSETRPSLCVDLNYGLWRCFGSCNTGGDIFSFYQKFFNVSFSEAVQDIAEMYGVELVLDEEVIKEREYKKSLYNINNIMCNKFIQQLEADTNAWNYLTQIRGFSPKIIKDFKLGCGLNKVPEKESLKTLGLLVQNEKGEWYSKFRRDRVVFPRFDEYGNIVSFTGRLCVEKDGAKYMHTSNTEIYNKSEHLFGLYQAKKYIKHFKSVICVEGECFKPDAEILTPNGWKRFDEYNNEPVMQVDDKLNGKFVTPIARIIKEYDGDLLECNNKNGKIIATPNHNIIYHRHNKEKSLDKISFKDINTQTVVPISINYSGNGVDLSENMIKLLIAIQADGSINIRKNNNKYIRISFKKERKILRFENLLKLNNIKYTKTLHKNGKTFFGFICNNAFKIFPNEWYNMTQTQLQAVLSELVYWDGNEVPNRNQIEYSTKSIENATFIQTIAHLCKKGSSIIKRSNKFGEWYKVSILFNKKTFTIKKEQIKNVPYKGKVYCVEVPSGMLLVRINNKITVVGNCDLIKCHQKSIVNSIAISGLNISDHQVNLLKKYTSTFYVCIEDGAILKVNDNGISPLSKFYDTIKRNIPYAKVYIVDLRNEDGSKCDPDMYLSEHTREEFTELVKHAKIYNEFVINCDLKKVNPKNIEEKTACINFLIPKLASIQNFLDRKQYIELVANKLSIPENDIYRKVKYYNEKQEKASMNNITWDSRPIYAQKILLSTCFAPNFDNFKACAELIIRAQQYLDPFYKKILTEMISPYILQFGPNKQIDFTEFFTKILYDKNVSEVERKIITDIYMKVEQLEDFDNDELDELIDEQCDTLKEYVFTEVQVDNLENSLELIDI